MLFDDYINEMSVDECVLNGSIIGWMSAQRMVLRRWCMMNWWLWFCVHELWIWRERSHAWRSVPEEFQHRMIVMSPIRNSDNVLFRWVIALPRWGGWHSTTIESYRLCLQQVWGRRTLRIVFSTAQRFWMPEWLLRRWLYLKNVRWGGEWFLFGANNRYTRGWRLKICEMCGGRIWLSWWSKVLAPPPATGTPIWWSAIFQMTIIPTLSTQRWRVFDVLVQSHHRVIQMIWVYISFRSNNQWVWPFHTWTENMWVGQSESNDSGSVWDVSNGQFNDKSTIYTVDGEEINSLWILSARSCRKRRRFVFWGKIQVVHK